MLRELARADSAIFDQSPIGMMQVARTGRVIAVNAAAATLVGTPPGELVGRSIGEMFAPDDHEQILATVSQVLETGQPIRHERVLTRSDGTTRLAVIALSRLATDQPGEATVLLTALDITAGRTDALRRAHEQKLDELGRLASGIAHEIRSPLQYVATSINFARSAVAELLGDEPSAQRGQLRAELDEAMVEVTEGIARIDQIVKGMNILSRRTGNTVEDHDVRNGFKFPLAVARGQAPPGTEFVVERGDVPLVACNLGLIQQVMLNLLVNAVHAIEDRLQAQPRHAGRITVASSYTPTSVCISVTDNGTGMEDHVVARAMEPFFTTKAGERGTGQGLALARDIMDQHGGTLTIETTLGEGSTVTLQLPRTD